MSSRPYASGEAPKSPSNSDADGREEPGLGITLIAIFVSALVLSPLWAGVALVVSHGSLSEARGSPDFFGAALGVLSAVAVAFAFQLRPAVQGFRRLARGDRASVVPLLLAFFGGVA